MNVLIKAATIVDPGGKHHGKKRDVLIQKGVISKIAASITDPKAREVKLKNLHISAGWFDPGVCFGEPGFEEREDIDNGLRTAALSGFTAVGVNPDTYPITDSKSQVKFLRTKAYGNPVDLYPIGSLTVRSEGVDLAELYDMQSTGAVAFYDYKRPVESANLLKIALQYAQNFDGLVLSYPMETTVAGKGLVNEEMNSTRLGLKGIPALSEEIQIARDLYILEYTGGKLHIPTISAAASVDLIKAAKKKGLNVSCSVSVNNLCLTDDTLEEFDARYKVLPPLRTSKDNKALLKALKDGVIDGVTSDHNPMDIEHKKTEFDHAEYGSIGLESCFGALNRATDVDTAVSALLGLKEVFNVPGNSVSEGESANLTLFDPDVAWTFSESDIHSTSANSAMLGEDLKGKAYGIYANGTLVLNE